MMAVTHADLVPSPKNRLGSKTGALLMVLNILFGLVCFILCLIAEATRSEMTGEVLTDGEKGSKFECKYVGSGKMPFISATAAFFSLAMAMLVQHVRLLVVISKSDSLLEISRDYASPIAVSFTRLAGCFFVTAWIAFAVGEILLLIGLTAEAGHLKNWSVPRASCHIVPQYMFVVAGVFGLLSVGLAYGLYNTCIRADFYFNEQKITGR